MILPTKVRVRVEGALSDLHAANARYHVNCITSFMSLKPISAVKNASKEDENTDPAIGRESASAKITSCEDSRSLFGSHCSPLLSWPVKSCGV